MPPPAPPLAPKTNNIVGVTPEVLHTKGSVKAEVHHTPGKVKPPRSTMPEANSRHLTEVQKIRIARIAHQLLSDVDIRVKTVADNAEAVQYANEINDLLNQARGLTNPLLRGMLWAKVPEGLTFCMHSEADVKLNEVSQKLGGEMAITGIAVTMNVDPSFPEHRITIVVGVQPID